MHAVAPSPAAEPTGTAGDPDAGGPGVYVVNNDGLRHGRLNGTLFFFYESGHDYVPYKYLLVGRLPPFRVWGGLWKRALTSRLGSQLAPWAAAFVTLCPTFEGRIVSNLRCSLWPF